LPSVEFFDVPFLPHLLFSTVLVILSEIPQLKVYVYKSIIPSRVQTDMHIKELFYKELSYIKAKYYY